VNGERPLPSEMRAVLMARAKNEKGDLKMILKKDLFSEFGQKMVGKKVTAETVKETLQEMGFAKTPKITIPARIHTTSDSNWMAITYNGMEIRFTVDSNNIVTKSGKCF
jgi:hypothetical protein